MAEDTSSMSGASSNEMWGGRFARGPAAIMEEINASVGFDQRLAAQDIRGSLAHATMLRDVGILEPAAADAICNGLTTILGEIEAGAFTFSTALEDVHMNIEARLAEL
ncbi:MAG: argininosuccinate lyase, partial [Planctomycetota bacterium]